MALRVDMHALQLGLLQLLRQLGNFAPHPLDDDLPINTVNIKRTPLNLFSDLRRRCLLLNFISKRIDDPHRGVPALPRRGALDSSGRCVYWWKRNLRAVLLKLTRTTIYVDERDVCARVGKVIIGTCFGWRVVLDIEKVLG